LGHQIIAGDIMAKSIFIICSVRGTEDDYRQRLEAYVSKLEQGGSKVHLPHRDTDQSAPGIEICRQNQGAILKADEVHVFYNSKSQGTHFDMGVAFALNKEIIVVENEEYGPGKSYPRMLIEWQGRKPLV